MELQKNSIAMVSPSHNAYSETFIQAQKNGLKGKVFYYYGGELPQFLEGYGKLNNRATIWLVKIKRKLGIKTFNAAETAFIKSLKQHKIEVVFAQYGTTAHRIVKICNYLKIPLITHFHGYDASIDAVISGCNNFNEVFKYSTYVIAVSNVMKNKLLKLGCPSQKMIYNVYAPDDIFFEVKPNFSNETFIALGRFVEKKAPYYTILAFSKVLNDYPNAQLIIGGQGELYEVCTNLVKYLKIENNVLLPGILSKEKFIGYLSTSVAFVQHSITALSGDQEGTPVAVLEASAAGLPVIATKHAGIPDVIIDGETGLLVDEHDVNGMAEQMLKVLKDKDLAKVLGSKGKERMKAHYTSKKQLQVLDDLIEKCINTL